MTLMRMRRRFRGVALLSLAVLALGASPHPGHDHEITVHRSATCGCCMKWVEHLRTSGFRVTEQIETDMGTVKQRLGVPGGMGSCHTATVDGYVIEGHVPADVIHQLLAERPDVVGLSVPNMLEGPPGMEAMARPGEPVRQLPYEVLAFDAAGNTRVYARR
jgi:hypothetical protein